MYLPQHFEQNDAQALQALMRAHPLATLVTQGAEGITADHVPLHYDASAGPHGTLLGHVARANPLWQHAQGQAVLAVFQGPQAYITPNGYPSKARHHKVVPTWNYTVVHAHGVLEAVDDAAWLHGFVSGLTQRHEAKQAAPWAVSDAPTDYIQQMLTMIVGIRIPLKRLVGKWKVSQNRDSADREGTAAALQSADPAAQAMARLVINPMASTQEPS